MAAEAIEISSGSRNYIYCDSNETSSEDSIFRANIPGDGPDALNNDEYFWMKKIKSSRKAQRNVLHFPVDVCRFLSFFPPDMELFDVDTGELYGCRVHTAARNSEEEVFIWDGWKEYARRKGLKKGDKLGFMINRVPHTLYVWLLNR